MKKPKPSKLSYQQRQARLPDYYKPGGGYERGQRKIEERERALKFGEDSPLIKTTKGVLAAASRVPYIGKYAQALSIGADLGTGISKSLRGDKLRSSKDFAQAAIGATMLTPLKATKFFKSGNAAVDVTDISEITPSGDAREKKKSRGVTVSYSKGGKISKKK